MSTAAEPTQGRVQVFVLAGQSNMEGKAKVQLLEYQVKQPATSHLFRHYQKDGKWVERDDVWIKFLDRKGKLTVGFGSPNCIGPELELGHVLGNRYEEPVLLIKTAWGGRSLYRDFRSPSAGLPPQAVLDRMLEEARKKKPEATPDEIQGHFGASYRAMVAEVNGTLAHLKEHFPEYEGQGYELAGFVWFQGWNDMISADATAEYTANLAHFIRDVRRDLKSPKLPFVVGQMGVDGLHAGANVERFKAAQAAILDFPEFKGNVAVVETDVHWDLEAEAVYKKGWRENLSEWNQVGSDWPYHYLGSAKTYCAIGKALGQAAIELR
jgi:alpha-galactosidase